MKKLLISGFEPFGQHQKNVSKEVVDRLDVKDVTIKKVLLPVVYDRAFDILKKAMDEFQPDGVLCLGMAGGRGAICAERVALNIKHSSSPDNEGVIYANEYIDQEGPVAYMSNMPFLQMIKDPNVQISYSAGTFVCNHIFYQLMHHIQQTKSSMQGGFIHLPYGEKQDDKPYIVMEEQVKILEGMIKEWRCHG